MDARDRSARFTWDDVDALQAAYAWIEHEYAKTSEFYPGTMSFVQRGRSFTYNPKRFMEAVGKIAVRLPPRTPPEAATAGVMAIVKVTRPRSTLEEFAVKHGLTMEIRERSAMGGPRWLAGFMHTEVVERGMLFSVRGQGSTPEAAIEDYGRRISERVLAVGAMVEDRRRDIQVPIIIPRTEPGAARDG